MNWNLPQISTVSSLPFAHSLIPLQVCDWWMQVPCPLTSQWNGSSMLHSFLSSIRGSETTIFVEPEKINPNCMALLHQWKGKIRLKEPSQRRKFCLSQINPKVRGLWLTTKRSSKVMMPILTQHLWPTYWLPWTVGLVRSNPACPVLVRTNPTQISETCPSC